MTEKSLTENFDENYAVILAGIKEAAEKSGRRAEDITLLAATKTVSPDFINYAVSKGIKYIGENRVQEFLSKDGEIDKSAHRRFIGHLQTNKVKDIVGKVEIIESVHSEKLALAISDFAEKKGIVQEILAEVNIGNEDTKSGFSPDELLETVAEIGKMKGIKLRGLMAIPPVSESDGDNCKYFEKMYKLFIDIRDKKIDNVSMDILSMGMSDDYYDAVRCGANSVRIGTALFGRRIYNK